MAFDDFEIVVPRDMGVQLCIPCATARGLNPLDDNDDTCRPIFKIDEVSSIPVCDDCGFVSDCCSFGPEAVEYHMGQIREALTEGRRSDFLDTIAEHLHWCIMDDDEHDDVNTYREAVPA